MSYLPEICLKTETGRTFYLFLYTVPTMKRSNAKTIVAHLRAYADYLETSSNVDRESRKFAAEQFNEND